MSDLLNLEMLDADGAIREAAEAAGLDRSDFLKRGVLAGGGLIAGGAFFSAARRRRGRDLDDEEVQARTTCKILTTR